MGVNEARYGLSGCAVFNIDVRHFNDAISPGIQAGGLDIRDNVTLGKAVG